MHISVSAGLKTVGDKINQFRERKSMINVNVSQKRTDICTRDHKHSYVLIISIGNTSQLRKETTLMQETRPKDHGYLKLFLR